MFTGIVQTKAVIAAKQRHGDFIHLVVQVQPEHLELLERGASIAINGVCLTATDFDQAAGTVEFDVIDETLKRSNLGLVSSGEQVNFERSLRFGKEIGGHLVSGHIQTTATLLELEKNNNNCRMRLQLPAIHLPYILAKGFIAVDGASLTVGAVHDDGFDLHLIPETLEVTTLGQRSVGDQLNIELDQQTVTIVQTVERVLAQRQG
ncbi:riboflavin synthase subunit alpha [Alkalimonas collagenimarina]|uniref:Riboflavin synthase n=1 Tax=Alkalimonas collagenimarina TaxID=400390 RepID=A0ABT9GW89_9GAMM|nr:riboflavin synthase subunit alpha [Alkalimonas collagenimarina]MDP4535302.1 riboflavin synthase subunit alpha [Alkalimonas collagenimarina]